MPDPVRRPAVIVADASPLIQLAQAGALHLLHRIGRVRPLRPERVQDADAGTIVLHEHGRVPRVVAGQGRGADLDVLTTCAFLATAEP